MSSKNYERGYLPALKSINTNYAKSLVRKSSVNSGFKTPDILSEHEKKGYFIQNFKKRTNPKQQTTNYKTNTTVESPNTLTTNCSTIS